MDSTMGFITMNPPFGRICCSLFPGIEQANPGIVYLLLNYPVWDVNRPYI